jgi:hypothetical protein
LEGYRASSAGKADALGDLGDSPHICKLVVVAGDQQDTVVLAGVDREGDRHPREHNHVVEGDEQEPA